MNRNSTWVPGSARSLLQGLGFLAALCFFAPACSNDGSGMIEPEHIKLNATRKGVTSVNSMMILVGG